MLQLDHVWRTYPVGDSEVVALRDVSLTIADDDFISIVGPSGSGKSTLLQILGLLDRPSTGRVLLDGQDLATVSNDERANLRLRTLGFVFQRFHLLNDLTALENVALPMEANGITAAERFKRASELLTAVGLAERMSFRPSRLSGGQRQRVAIARALANDPAIILADEPTGELHSDDRAAVVDIFRRLHDEGRAVIIVTHDMEVAAVTDRHIEIRDGEVTDSSQPSSRPTESALSLAERPAGAIVGGRQIKPPPPKRSWKRVAAAIVGLTAVVVAVVAFSGGQFTGGGRQVVSPTPATAPARVARGEVHPEQEARLRSVTSGFVVSLNAAVGATVLENQEIARIRGVDGSVSLVTAPWRGTITGLPIHQGDSVIAGSILATVGDLSRLHVETTDVDEFLIPQVQVGLPVHISLDALPVYDLTGVIAEVSLQTEVSPEGDQHYPVTVRFDWTPPDVRPGMTARIHFPASAS